MAREERKGFAAMLLSFCAPICCANFQNQMSVMSNPQDIMHLLFHSSSSSSSSSSHEQKSKSLVSPVSSESETSVRLHGSPSPFSVRVDSRG